MVVDELLNQSASMLEKKDLPLERYQFLEAERVKKQILQFSDGSFARLALHLPAIHCSSCIYLLENLAKLEEGILEVQVHFSRKEASIAFRQDQISLPQLAALLDYIGYAPDFQTQTNRNSGKKNRLLIQLGVAGFFFGNTMLLALPEYFDQMLPAEAELQQFFRFLMLAFSLPVVIFSGQDYFRNTFKSLRAGVLSIDLPVALGLSALFLRSAFEVIWGLGPGYFDSLTGLVFFLLVGKWYQAKTYRNFAFDRDLRSFLPLAANLLLKNDKKKPVAIDELQAGDLILVKHGEVVPADVLLLEDQAQVDYSYLTGESQPLVKKRGEAIYAGGRILHRPARLEVRKSADHSYLGELWAHESFTENTRKTSRSLTDRISQYFTPTIVVFALAAALYWWPMGVGKALNVFTAVLIVACPCALALAEPFANGSMLRWFGRYGLYLKNSKVLNRLSEARHLVFDKTGTLTCNDKIQVSWHGKALEEKIQQQVLAVAQQAQHPLAKALMAHLSAHRPALEKAFFYEKSGEGLTAEIGRDYLRMGKASFLGLPDDQAQTTAVYLEHNGKLLGHFAFHQALRPGLRAMLRKLDQHFGLTILSGDNAAEEMRFRQIFPRHSQLHFGQSPKDKRSHLERLQASGDKVIMLGDGLNDAGALQQSEVGISLCEEEVNFFPASDGLLRARSFWRLGDFLRLSRQNRQLIYLAFGLSFLYNVVGLSFAFLGWLSPLFAAILMPVSSVSVVLFTTLGARWLAKRQLAGDTSS